MAAKLHSARFGLAHSPYNPEVPGSIPGLRWSVFCHILDILGSLFHFFVDFGLCCEVLGRTVGTFSGGFGRVSGKSSQGVKISTFPETSGSIFPAAGVQKHMF